MKTTFTALSALLLISSLVYAQESQKLPNKEVSHIFYATGNLNTITSKSSNTVLKALASEMTKNTDATLLLLGNNLGPKGFDKDNEIMNWNVENYSSLLRPFSDRVIFIPGISDWSRGLENLKDQENHLEKILGNKDIFQPENGCPIEKIEINDAVDLLLLDSQGALSNWDEIPNINDKCEIKNKRSFYEKVEHEIVKSEGKTVLVATYHPISSNGKYGSPYAFGISPKSLNNKNYNEFSERLLNIAQQSRNLVFLSSHEQNMQYIIHKKVPIVISGAGGTIVNARKWKKNRYTFNENGFSKIVEFTDGSIWVVFYGKSNNYSLPLFSKEMVPPSENIDIPNFNEKKTPEFVSKSIYEPNELRRSGFYRLLWGEHFRKDYETPVKAKSALLDTLYGGLTVVRKGGGHQTNSLRLKTKDDREYVMRSLKKSAIRFIQYFIFKTEYLEPDIEDTYFIQLMQDYWTTANPYGNLTISDLSDALKIYHPNTELYYIPKQKALGIHNEGYGDKLYFIEERITDGHGDVVSLGRTDKIESTADLLDELRRKDKIAINESLYIRTRLFDNIIGDWDRHADQWRWAVQDRNGQKFYEPIPRDRDQVYSDFDGFMLGTLTTFNPFLRFMQRYDETYNHTKWFNDAGDDVDYAVLINHTREDWLREARYIKENLTKEVIDRAFKNFPDEIDQIKLDRTKNALLGRLDKVEENAINLYEFIRSNVVITGTDKSDYFVITRKPNGITNVSAYRIKDGKKTDKYWDVDYDKKVTNEIWIYGLDNKDTFEVNGKSEKYIRIKIIGGQNNDTYQINNSTKIRVFDQKSEPNTFETSVNKSLSDSYDLNTYHFMKNRRDLNHILPLVAINPDDGLRVGATFNYTKNSLRRNPFTANHNLGFIFITETSGVQVTYDGEFANIFDKVNLGIKTGYNSSSFTNNFFGLGNETLNFDDDLDFDFNRVRLKKFIFSPNLIFRGYQGSKISFGLSYENIEVERTIGRFIETANVNENVFNGQDFFGTEATYEFQNYDNKALPKSGIGFKLTAGYKANFDEDKGFGYVMPELKLTTKIDRQGILVYATKFKATFNLNDDFEFHQAASIGDGDGLRGFRQQRFSGKTAYYQNSDLRLSLGRIRNAIVPISWGVYAGFDYGRVWVEDDDSSKWHNTPGVGLFFNLAGLTTANFGYFDSDDGGRVNILFSLAF